MSSVNDMRPGQFHFVVLQSGDFGANSPEETVRRLGERIAADVLESDQRYSEIRPPEFSSGLSPLTEVFARIAQLTPEKRFVLVIDEFDAMEHPELYQPGPVASPFFQTLQSLGTKRNVGVLLVGGERMRFVVSTHGLALNKFVEVAVDYFNGDQNGDFADLVRVPVRDWLIIDDEAVEVLHRQTAGNPWITHLVAREMFERHRLTRDGHVTLCDMQDAVEAAIPRLSATSFQHFWDDAIQAEGDEKTYVSLMRRRVLLAIAQCLRARSSLTEENICAEARSLAVDEPAARDVIRGFKDRRIVVSGEDGIVAFRVPLFARWLADVGVREIITSMGDDDALIQRQRREEEERPKASELEALAERWRTYAGEVISPNRIARWLEQFGPPGDQRLMLKLLQRLRYYRADYLRERLRQLHEFVIRDLAANGYAYTFKGKERVRSDLVVCGLEGGGSGAGHLVKPYRDENGIFSQRAVDSAHVRNVLRDTSGSTKAVIILEDFIATGKTAERRLEALHSEWTKESAWPAEVEVYVMAACGFEDGLERVRAASARLGWTGRVNAADVLDDGDRCFSEESRIFPDMGDRERARKIAWEQGVKLDKKQPLGYEESQAAVCFEARCPNNSLAILWGESEDWTPLFRR